MNIKRRTLNELRQTKDSFYVTSSNRSTGANASVIEGYLSHMREEQRTSQVSLKNFLIYMEQNGLHIVKG
jgi:hypothetical protein